MSSKESEARPGRHADPSINVTPLIDVLLVLLIIFMVIQPQREAKLEVKAPQASEAPNPPASPSTLMLTVSRDFQLALNTKPLQTEELLTTLADLMEQRPADYRTLFIKAPRQLRYETIALLVDLAKGAGVVTIGLVSADE